MKVHIYCTCNCHNVIKNHANSTVFGVNMLLVFVRGIMVCFVLPSSDVPHMRQTLRLSVSFQDPSTQCYDLYLLRECQSLHDSITQSLAVNQGSCNMLLVL